MSFSEVMLIITFVLLLVVLYKVFKQDSLQPKDVEHVISRAWNQSGIEEKIGRIATYAADIRNDYRALDQMLRSPRQRGSIGEIALEAILSDQLPPDNYGIRKPVRNGKIPDAHIVLPNEYICIDSKFPLDNYRKMIDTNDEREQQSAKRQFLRDVEKHLAKIAQDYVSPEQGSAPFALAFLPSESVYYFLVTEPGAYSMLQQYVRKGVQVVSPLTLEHKLALIKTGILAYRLSEKAEQIRSDVRTLAEQFEALRSSWETLSTHVRNMSNKMQEVDRVYKRLSNEFERIKRDVG